MSLNICKLHKIYSSSLPSLTLKQFRKYAENNFKRILLICFTYIPWETKSALALWYYKILCVFTLLLLQFWWLLIFSRDCRPYLYDWLAKKKKKKKGLDVLYWTFPSFILKILWKSSFPKHLTGFAGPLIWWYIILTLLNYDGQLYGVVLPVYCLSDSFYWVT